MPPRRSTRIKTKVYAPPSDTDDGETEDKKAAPKPMARSRHVRGRRGSLENLPKMPLDVIFEVLAYMSPLDLLYLARTSKDFRALLMKRSSAAFWKAARANVDDLPICPSLISEPMYASLLFENCCSGCLKRNVNSIYWGIGARLCHGCLPELTMRPNSTVLVWKGTPVHSYSCKIFREHVIPYSRSQGLKVFGDRWLVSDVELFKQIWEATSEDKRAALLEERKALVSEWEALVPKFIQWTQARKEDRSNELAELKGNRREGILQKLADLGWSDELDRMSKSGAFDKLMVLANAKEPKQLTERAWNRIEPAVIGFLEKFKRERLFQELRDLLRPRFYSLRVFVQDAAIPFREVFPSVREFSLLPSVRQILDVPKTEQTAIQLEDLKPQLPALVADWKAQVTAALVKVINNHAALKVPPNAGLEGLAIGAFLCCSRDACKLSAEPASYPDVFPIACKTSMYGLPIPEVDPTADDYTRLAAEDLRGCSHQYSTWTFRIMVDIMSTYRCDPKTATIKEMDENQTRLICTFKDCKSDVHIPGVQVIFGWRSAMYHALKNGRELSTFRVAEHLSDDTFQRVQELEAIASKQALHAHQRQLTYRRDDLIEHLAKLHNIQEADAGPDDFYDVPHTMVLGKDPIYLLSRKMPLKDIVKAPPTIRRAIEDGHADWSPTEDTDDMMT
ncbi:hypothetical protein BXZ70DRAFT_1034141 [Cristinia sonorae]|uniref:F-box domain-containing protein n=1 Tax=Cristinia sonorae TaxID=1940300 RepID=A0A8K0UKP7_9AGAR|nr:hypothetical protein BXZ70DRAFT_1034141 [Cristinia sonorae]